MSSFTNKKVATAATLTYLTTNNTSAGVSAIKLRRLAKSDSAHKVVDLDEDIQGETVNLDDPHGVVPRFCDKGNILDFCGKNVVVNLDSDSDPKFLFDKYKGDEDFKEACAWGIALRSVFWTATENLSGSTANNVVQGMSLGNAAVHNVAHAASVVSHPVAAQTATQAQTASAVTGWIGTALSVAAVTIRFSQIYHASKGMTTDKRNYILESSFFENSADEGKLCNLWNSAYAYAVPKEMALQPLMHTTALQTNAFRAGATALQTNAFRAERANPFSQLLPQELREPGQQECYYLLPVKTVVALCALDVGGLPMAQMVYELNNPELRGNFDAGIRCQNFQEAEKSMDALIGVQ